MNKLSKIFLVIIVILTIALGLATYYLIYYREAYFSAANQLYEVVKSVEDEGNEKID